jgi:hypothetical protein
MPKFMPAVIVLVLILAACNSETAPNSSYATLSATLSTGLPSPERSTVANNHSTKLPGSVESTDGSCVENAAAAPVRYDMKAVLDWPAHSLHVRQQVFYRNETGQLQKTLVLNVEPNREPNQFALESITSSTGSRIENYTLENTRLTIYLTQPLLIHCQVELVLVYTLTPPRLADGYSQGYSGYHLGYWGYSTRQLNLGLWFPVVAVFGPAQDWVTPRLHSVGEQDVLQTADFSVEIQIPDAPEKILLAGPGQMTRLALDTWRFELVGGRDLTLSISEEFKTISTETASGVKVELFYFPDLITDQLDAPRHALETAADALALYETLYDPYPHERMVVVQGDFPDGMEFSGLVFVSGDWFRTWLGVPNDWLTIITAHEVSHQWWYAMVGNDQGNYPYIDEALAIYSEVLFFEKYYPEFVEWWWDFRVGAYSPGGYVDSTVYEFYSARGYINAIYLRGAQMMQALRTDLGDEVFFAWLSQYAQQMKGQLATPADLWGLLPSDEYRLTETTRANYLRKAEVLPPSEEIP